MNELLLDFIKRSKERKVSICVIGDSVIDEYYNVKVTRISPESPNNCVSLSEEFKPKEILPGGAANVVFALKDFNVNSFLISFLDKKAKRLFEEKNINLISIDLPKNSFVPRKRRYFDNDIQVGNRWDIEKKNYGLETKKLIKLQNKIKKELGSLKGLDAIVLSDYNKGLFYKDFSFIQKGNCPIIVDPKNHPLSKWRNRCDIFKPNSIEAFNLSEGLTDWRRQCDFFQNEINCSSVVITQQGNGIVGKTENEYFEYIPKNSVIPAKISGAGDFYIGILTIAVSLGFSIKDAAIIAFECGRIYVTNKSRDSIKPWQLTNGNKLIDIEELKILCEELKKENKKIGFTNGCFDFGLTAAHVQYLQYAKKQVDFLIVALNSDESVKRLKGINRPIMSLQERMKVVSGLECVNFVISFDEDAPLNLIKEIKPNIIIKGGDYKKEEVVGCNIVDEVIITQKFNCISTTNKINIYNI